MTRPTINNAFNESTSRAGEAPTADISAERASTAKLATMRIDLRESKENWRLTVSPILPVDALRALPQAGSPAVMENLLILDDHGTSDDSSNAVLAIAERIGVGIIERFGPERLVLKDGALIDLVTAAKPSGFRVIRVAGPIELRDASAMANATAAGHSPMDVELRATCALHARADRTAELVVREKEDALRFAAENFRHYLAALRDEPASGFEAPHFDQLDRLLSLSGHLTLRPIETQCFASFVDVGLSTNVSGEKEPADRSLIYDLPSQSWHDEP